MAFVFTCTQCQKRHEIDDDNFLGKKVRCSCGNVVKLAAPKKAETPVEEIQVESAAPVPIAPVPVAPIAVNPVAPTSVPPDPMQLDPSLASGTSVFDAHSNVAPAPAYPPPTYPAASARPKSRRGQGQQYSQQAVIRMLMSMAAGTMLIVFAIIVIAGAMYFFSQGSDISERVNRSSFRGSSFPGSASNQDLNAKWRSSDTRSYRSFMLLGCLTLGVGLLCIAAGGCQYTVSWLRFLKSETRFSWADAMVAAVSVISIVAIFIGCFYANYQVAQFFSFGDYQSEISQLNSRGQSEMARQAQQRLDEAKKAQSKIHSRVQWTIFKQGFIHAVFPCIALGICGFRIFKE